MGHYEELKTQNLGMDSDLYLALKAKLMHQKSTEEVTIIGIPPITIISNGNNATVGLKGNEEHTGTPSPQNPVMPQGTGERTGNLFDYSAITTGYRIQWTTGNPYADDTAIMSDYIPVTEGDYALSMSVIIVGYASDKSYVGVYRSDKTWEKTSTSSLFSTFTVLGSSDVKFIRLMTYAAYEPITNTLMLNPGTTVLPYEKFGYKIPISSASTTTPVYLGEVESIRRIKKLVLTGNETFYRDYERNDSWRFYSLSLVQAAMNTGICSHFEYIGTSGVNSSDNIGYSLFSASQFGCRFPKSIASTVNEFKAWLAQQYAAGTPVTIWYVLTTPETSIVNEPLMRIGDYADEVSNITVPTIKGTNIVDVDTEIKPSEISITYTKGKEISINNISDMENLTIADLEKMTIAELEG